MMAADALRLTALDRALAWIAPRAAARRIAARAALTEMVRAYDGAKKGRRGEGWHAAGTSADAEIAAAGATLRHRSREQRRNNPLYASGVSVWTSALVGDGIRPRATTGNTQLDARLNQGWEDLCGQIDADGHGDIYSLQTLQVSEMVEGGECFIRRRLRRRSDMRTVDGREVAPLQIQLYEADHLDDSRDFFGSESENIVRQGIEYDAIGRRVAYWMFPEHPGDTGVTRAFRSRLESVRVPAAQIAHLYERQRIQQRGVPWGAPVLRALRDFDDSADAERMARKIASCVAAMVIPGDESGDTSIAPTVTDADGRKIEQMRPGMIAMLRGGKDVKFNSPPSATGVSEWMRTQLLQISAGFRLPYEMLLGDLSGVNYSSYKAGDIKFRRLARALQWQVVIPMACQPVWDWFVEAGYLAGLWPVAQASCEWDPPGFDEVDRAKEAQADLAELRMGATTLPRIIARRGYDPRATLEEIAQTNALLDALGLVLDSDPRRVTQAGGAQAAPSTEGAGEPGEGEEEDRLARLLLARPGRGPLNGHAAH